MPWPNVWDEVRASSLQPCCGWSPCRWPIKRRPPWPLSTTLTLQVCNKEFQLSGFLIINQNHPQEDVSQEDEIEDLSSTRNFRRPFRCPTRYTRRTLVCVLRSYANWVTPCQPATMRALRPRASPGWTTGAGEDAVRAPQARGGFHSAHPAETLFSCTAGLFLTSAADRGFSWAPANFMARLRWLPSQNLMEFIACAANLLLPCSFPLFSLVLLHVLLMMCSCLTDVNHCRSYWNKWTHADRWGCVNPSGAWCHHPEPPDASTGELSGTPVWWWRKMHFTQVQIP